MRYGKNLMLQRILKINLSKEIFGFMILSDLTKTDRTFPILTDFISATPLTPTPQTNINSIFFINCEDNLDNSIDGLL